MKTATAAEMRAADNFTINTLGVPGITLMDRAADGIFESLSEKLGGNLRFTILCGKGNNGGDGWALTVKLCSAGERVTCISLFGEPVTADALYYYHKCLELNKQDSLEIVSAETNDVRAEEITALSDVIVEAVFGTGFEGDISANSTAGRLFNVAKRANALKIAADIPAGVRISDGTLAEAPFFADITVTFTRPKLGMFSYPAREACGEVRIYDIGVPPTAFKESSNRYEISDEDTVREYLPKRLKNSNKGSYGRLLCYVGSENMPGAARLALSGALRSGVGLVCAASPKCVSDILKVSLSEPIYLPLDNSQEDAKRLCEYSEKCTALLIGCGIGQSEIARRNTMYLIENANCPLIIDADGINILSSDINILKEARSDILLTPHPMELSRLTGLSVSEINASRISVASHFAREYGVTLLLKGAGTVISDKTGRICVNTTGGSALSKGGSGDVLAGMISALAAQGTGLYESAVVGAYLHGRAGDVLANELSDFGVLPSDIPYAAARIISEILR